MMYWVFDSSTVGPQMAKMMQFVPQAMRRFLGEENLGFFTPLGMMSICYSHPFVYSVLMVFPAVLFGREVSSARDKGILELTLGRSVSRREYLATLMIFFLAGLAFIVLCLLAGVGFSIWIYGMENSLLDFIPVIANLFFLFVFLGSMALLISVSAESFGGSVGWMIGLPLGLFMLEFLGKTIALIGAISPINPFSYYHPQTVLTESGFPLDDILILTCGAAVLVVFSFIKFRRIDL